MVCNITCTNGAIPKEETEQYFAYIVSKYHREPYAMEITLDGDFVSLSCDFGFTPFQRIRRITGYLVGTLDRFNNAKRAEVHDRVKHGTEE